MTDQLAWLMLGWKRKVMLIVVQASGLRRYTTHRLEAGATITS